MPVRLIPAIHDARRATREEGDSKWACLKIKF